MVGREKKDHEDSHQTRKGNGENKKFLTGELVRNGKAEAGAEAEGRTTLRQARTPPKEPRNVPDGKKESPWKTYETLCEANDKVWRLNEEMEEAMEELAVVYRRCEEASRQRVLKDKKKDYSCEKVDQVVGRHS